MTNSISSTNTSSKALTLQSVKDQFFKKNVHDIIRGIRAINPNGVGNADLSSQEKQFLNSCLAESFNEIQNTDMNIKMNAIQKLVYLNMLGYDISTVQFCVVELMSSNKFTHKRVGYLAAIQSFSEDSDMILLATNQIKKDLTSLKAYETELVLNALSVFMNAELAEILLEDILSLGWGFLEKSKMWDLSSPPDILTNLVYLFCLFFFTNFFQFRTQYLHFRISHETA